MHGVSSFPPSGSTSFHLLSGFNDTSPRSRERCEWNRSRWRSDLFPREGSRHTTATRVDPQGLASRGAGWPELSALRSPGQLHDQGVLGAGVEGLVLDRDDPPFRRQYPV